MFGNPRWNAELFVVYVTEQAAFGPCGTQALECPDAVLLMRQAELNSGSCIENPCVIDIFACYVIDI
jgi:hypothetical protein